MQMHVLDSTWETVKREFDAARQRSAQEARSEVVRDIHQALRRLRQYRTEAEWTTALLDGISELIGASDVPLQLAFFGLREETLSVRGQRGLALPDPFSFSAPSAPAFASAISAKDTVLAMRRASEVTEALSSAELNQRAYIVPILNGSRVVGTLFAAGEHSLDVHALELIANIASIVLERQANASIHTQVNATQVNATQVNASLPPKREQPPRKMTLSPWADLKEPHRLLHLRAQRFSRVKVAEMHLFKPDACRSGREQGNFYLFLKPEIDAARDSYGKQFMTIPSMVDYLHLELVRTAADGDELKLGADYPGQLL
jgi:hypothetical protein